MTEPDSRLTIEDKLFSHSKDMIQIREEAVKLKSIRIPVGQDTSTKKSLQQSLPYPATYAMDGPFAETGTESIWRSTDYKSMLSSPLRTALSGFLHA